MNNERKKERKKRELLTLKHDILVYFESWKRERERIKDEQFLREVTLICMKKERKKGKKRERDRERDNRNLMRKKSEGKGHHSMRRNSLWLTKNVETSQYTQMKREEMEKEREKEESFTL